MSNKIIDVLKKKNVANGLTQFEQTLTKSGIDIIFFQRWDEVWFTLSDREERLKNLFSN